MGRNDDREEECEDEGAQCEDEGSDAHSLERMGHTQWAKGNRDDREDEHDGREPDEDGEPSLGSLSCAGMCGGINGVLPVPHGFEYGPADYDQERWAEGDNEDFEDEHDGREHDYRTYGLPPAGYIATEDTATPHLRTCLMPDGTKVW
jgi:hypothetical protein